MYVCLYVHSVVAFVSIMFKKIGPIDLLLLYLKDKKIIRRKCLKNNENVWFLGFTKNLTDVSFDKLQVFLPFPNWTRLLVGLKNSKTQ